MRNNTATCSDIQWLLYVYIVKRKKLSPASLTLLKSRRKEWNRSAEKTWSVAPIAHITGCWQHMYVPCWRTRAKINLGEGTFDEASFWASCFSCSYQPQKDPKGLQNSSNLWRKTDLNPILWLCACSMALSLLQSRIAALGTAVSQTWRSRSPYNPGLSWKWEQCVNLIETFQPLWRPE